MRLFKSCVAAKFPQLGWLQIFHDEFEQFAPGMKTLGDAAS